MDINFGQIFISFLVLVFSLTVHETAHAWAADRLGDPTARLLGRVSLNPIVHVDVFGTILFPLLGMITHAPIIGWAKPVPIAPWRFDHPRRGHLMVAAAGPLSNLLLAFLAAVGYHALAGVSDVVGHPVLEPIGGIVWEALRMNVLLAVFNLLPIPPLDGASVLAGLLPERAAARLDRLQPYGFVLLYALLLSGGFRLIVGPPYRFLLSWLQ